MISLTLPVRQTTWFQIFSPIGIDSQRRLFTILATNFLNVRRTPGQIFPGISHQEREWDVTGPRPTWSTYPEAPMFSRLI